MEKKYNPSTTATILTLIMVGLICIVVHVLAQYDEKPVEEMTKREYQQYLEREYQEQLEIERNKPAF